MCGAWIRWALQLEEEPRQAGGGASAAGGGASAAGGGASAAGGGASAAGGGASAEPEADSQQSAPFTPSAEPHSHTEDTVQERLCVLL